MGWYNSMLKSLDKKEFFAHEVMKQGGYLDQAWMDLWWASPQSGKAMILPLNFNLPVSFPALNWDPAGSNLCLKEPVIIHFMGDAWKPFDRSELALMSQPEKLWWTNYEKWCAYRKTSCTLRLGK